MGTWLIALAALASIAATAASLASLAAEARAAMSYIMRRAALRESAKEIWHRGFDAGWRAAKATGPGEEGPHEIRE